MWFQWLKRYMPRGLYGRAALILVLPVVTLQLVVSVVFIQRHFEGVTEQLTRETARAVTLALDSADREVAAALELRVTDISADARPERDIRRWYDVTGIVVEDTFRDRLPGLRTIALPDDHDVLLYIETGDAMTRVTLDRERVSASNPHQLFVNMVFFGALMTVIAFVYLRNQLRPIARLADAAEAFGKGQTVPYRPSGAVEVRAAGHAFLDMRARIERQIEQRTLMLSGVSHDLRTPLTRLRLGLSLLDDAHRDPLERDVDDMQHLIDAFLEFARGDVGSGRSEAVDAQRFVAEIVADMRRSGARIDFEPTVGQGSVMLRPRAVRRAVENLIGNAMRYGTRCRVSAVLGDAALRIAVEDDGPGIPADQRDAALRPFVRLDPSRNQDRGSGVGLGLAIAADVANAHGGALRLSESPTLGGLRAELVLAC